MSKRQVVGDADCSIDLVVEQVKASYQIIRLGNRLEKLCQALELPGYVGKGVQRMYCSGQESTVQLLVRVLDEWTYKRASGAYLDELMEAFEKINLMDIRDKLEERFIKDDSGSSRPSSSSSSASTAALVQ